MTNSILAFVTRRLGIHASLAALSVTAALAGPIPATIDKPITIMFEDYNLASAGVGADATKQMMQEFMDANPDIKVVGVPVPPSEVTSRAQADMVAGRAADLAQMPFSDLDFIVHSLGAVALEDIIPPDELKADFQGMSPNGLQLGVMDGKTYGLAYTFSTPVLFYNATAFRAAGLDPDKPPKTWDEVKADAIQIHDKAGKIGFIGGFWGADQGDWIFQGLVDSNGGGVLSADRKTLTFANAPALGAVQMLRGLADAGTNPDLSLQPAMDTVSTGNFGMYLQTSALQTYLLNAAKDKFEVRAAPMPSFGDKPTRPTNSGSALVVLTHDPVKQRAAWELMKFLTSKHGYTIITSKIGYLPLRTDIVDDPQYLGPWVKDHPMVRPNLEQLSRLTPLLPMPGANYRQIDKRMMDAVEQSVYGGGDPVAIMTDAQTRAQALMPK